eukprot:2149511-Karenia_brevis.AAC.1
MLTAAHTGSHAHCCPHRGHMLIPALIGVLCKQLPSWGLMQTAALMGSYAQSCPKTGSYAHSCPKT